MRRAVTSGLTHGLLIGVVGLGLAWGATPNNAQACDGCCNGTCASACCDTCYESNGDNCGCCCPYTLFSPLIGLARLLGAGCDPCGCHGCGNEIWIGEWRNRCCDPCDSCGNFTGQGAPYVNGDVMGTPTPAATGGCNCGGYTHRGNATMANGYVNSRSVPRTSYVSQRSQPRPMNYAARPVNPGYAPRPMVANGEAVGKPRIISVTDDVVTPARTAGVSTQTSRSR